MIDARTLRFAFGSLSLCAVVATTAAAQDDFPREGRVTANVLNVRATPNGRDLGSVRSGTRLRVVGRSGSWLEIERNNGQRGYVFARYVQLGDSIGTEEGSGTRATVTATALNVRSGPGSNYRVVGGLRHDAEVEILERQGNWTRIRSSQGTGWVYGTHLEVIAEEAPSDAERARITANALNLRSGPGTNYRVVGSLPRGAVAAVVDRQGNWAQVRTSSQEGWVSASYLETISTGDGVGISGRIEGEEGGSSDRGEVVRADAPDAGTPDVSTPVSDAPVGDSSDPLTRPGSLPDGALGSLDGAAALANSRDSDEAQYQHYARLAATVGGTFEQGANQRTVLGIRGVDPNGTVHAESSRNYRAYTDTFVVLWRDGSGRAHVETFRGSTTPGQAATRLRGTPDANGDGRKDIAHIRPGVHAGYQRRTYKGRSAYGTWDTTPTYRDTNQDGRISDAEARASVRRGDLATGILFHRGNSNRPASVGCQTMSSTVFAQFERALGGDRRWDYILVDPR